MSRQTGSSQKNYSKATKPVKAMGRPQDDPLQTHFMKMLRPVKLPAINSQSEAELACFQYQDKNPKYYAKRELKGDQDSYAVEKINWIKAWFYEYEKRQTYVALAQVFKEGIDQWEFKEIHSKEDFPKYLFCDECDLSYVLNFVLHSNNPKLKNSTQFSQDELLFLELLCFAARDQISFAILKSLKQNFSQVIKNMEHLKDRIMNHFMTTSGEDSFQKKLNIKEADWFHVEINDIPKERKGEYTFIFEKKEENEANDRKEQDEESVSQQNKTKGIKKKLGRPAKRSKEQEKAPNDLLPKEALENVLHKLMLHIAWSYRYILNEQFDKKNLLKDTLYEQ